MKLWPLKVGERATSEETETTDALSFVEAVSSLEFSIVQGRTPGRSDPSSAASASNMNLE